MKIKWFFIRVLVQVVHYVVVPLLVWRAMRRQKKRERA